jgi:hypothetical protein
MAISFPVASMKQKRVVYAKLAETFKLKEGQPVDLQRSYWDTFDWRLHAAGECLRLDTQAKEMHLVWSTLDGKKCLGSLNLARPLRFATDLPTGPLRERLQKRTNLRALLSVATFDLTSQTTLVLDSAEKTQVRLVFDVYRLATKDTSRPVRWLRLVGMRGYSAALARVQSVVEEILGRGAVKDSEYQWALAQTAASPGNYSAKLAIELAPDRRADVAMKHICSHLLLAMQANEAGVREDLDTEFLHDYRVAVRRTRCALGQIKHVLPTASARHFAAEFAWLGQMTGPLRDLDVALLSFDDYQASLPTSLRKALEPLRLRQPHREHVHVTPGARSSWWPVNAYDDCIVESAAKAQRSKRIPNPRRYMSYASRVRNCVISSSSSVACIPNRLCRARLML